MSTDGPQPTYVPHSAEPWIVKSSRLLVDDQWLKLRADDCAAADGVEIAPFYVFEYPDWVNVIALDPEDNIVLVEQYRHGIGVTTLELPGGAIDASDSTPLAAAARELEEETGFTSDKWKYMGRLSLNPSNQSNYIHVILAEDVRWSKASRNDPRERIKTVRMPVREAVQLAFSGKLNQSMHVASMAIVLSQIGKWL